MVDFVLDDLLTELETESTTYTFAYGGFALRSSIKIGSRTLAEYDYTNDRNNYLSALDYGNGDKVQYTYDKQGRLVTQTYEDGDTVTYKYDNNGALATVIDSATGVSTKYYYDFTERLMKYAESGADYSHSVAYTYDLMNNLTGVVETINGTEFTSTYGYNTGELGSPTSVVQYSYGDSDWGDLVTQIGSNAITYDEIGNMLTFGARSFTWEHGRQLASQTINGSTWTYTYNVDGMRTKRTNQETVYTYEYNGSRLSYMTYGSITMRFTYGADGTPLSIVYNGTTYYYATNLQGDVVAILNSAGNLVVEYYYDGWGRLLSTSGSMASSLGFCNPLRYRGYVYDRETGLYYLQSRYYNPTWGRFVNADNWVSAQNGFTGSNLFVYCLNSPVNYVDTTGEFPWLTVGIVAVACVAIIGIDHVLAANQPEDGYAVHHLQNENGTHERAIYIEGNGFEMDLTGVTLCDFEAGFINFNY